MDTKIVFKEIDRINGRIEEEQEVIKALRGEAQKTQDLCSHEIIFKYRDDHPRKLAIDGKYMCPACGKAIQCIRAKQLKETEFKDSRIIPLTHLSLLGSPTVFQAIREEVRENMDIYYDPSISTEILERKMENILRDQQNHYESPIKVFQREGRKRDIRDF